jgi:uroporphyrinogen-III synthase
MTDTPLAGLNIVVTRPREQALILAQRITALGGKATQFPLLEIEPLSDAPALREIVSRLAQFDLAIFISPNAVRHGMAAIRAASGLPANVRIATVGQMSAQALREVGVQQVIAPLERFDSEALLALPELNNVEGWKVMIFRGDGGRELLGKTLRSRGATIEYATCYRRLKPQADINVLLGSLPDVVTVSSSEALRHLDEMLDEPNRTRLAAVPLFVSHARIAEQAETLGWKKVFTTAGGDDGVISGLVAWSASVRM